MRLLLPVLLTATLSATTHYVTVAGLGGEAEYEQRFTAQAREIDKLLKSAPDSKVHTLFGPEATKDRLIAILSSIARETKADDSLVLMLIGHGSYDGSDYKFNVKGPDISSTELAAQLDRIPARQLVVNMTSCSGGSVPGLQKPNRAVITATKSGTEKNATVFARYWVEALRDPAADTDKNEIVSALEAFKFADQKTTSFYETQKRIATEHPVLEDTGTGEPARAPSTENGQGLLAARFALLRLGAAQKAAADPAKRALLTKREQLEQQIDKLKYEKAAMPVEDYRKQLSAFLLELAKVQEELDK